jgi:hypothetical protein
MKPFLPLRSVALGAALAVLACAGRPAAAQLPFFPGAEGYGGSFAGTAPPGGWFSNATVYHVTTTQDLIDSATGKPAFGTLRGAFYDYANPRSPKQGVTNRVVVFDVGGTFQLTQGKLDIKTVNNIYVAGQTAPSPVTVYGNMTQITKSSDTVNSNVILRYMTFRKGTGPEEDAISFTGGNGAGDSVASHMIMDHVSASWAEDENLSVANNNTNLTVQYSIIADALTSGHAYGSLIRPKVDANVTFHHNLYANNLSRQARFGSYNPASLTADFRNNVIYNWKNRASYAGGSTLSDGREAAAVNYVGNYLVAGPDLQAGYSATQVFGVDQNIDLQLYQSQNYIDSDRTANPSGIPNGAVAPTSAFVLSSNAGQTLTMLQNPLPTAPVTTQPAPEAFDRVLAYVGNSYWARDAVDARIINNVRTNTGPPGGVAAAEPNAAELAGVLNAPTVARPAGFDTDNDGMPDAWEIAHGLNPASPNDWNLDFDNDGYVNLIEYINDLYEMPAPTPIVYTGAASNRYASILNWKTDDGGLTAGSNWQPGKDDLAIIRSGTAVVDAIGQRAGQLVVAPQGGGSAALHVTGGRLNVTAELIVLTGGTAVVNHSGGEVRASQLAVGGTEPGSATYNLSGGTLIAKQVLKGVNGHLNITGGTASVEVFVGSFENNGGTIDPPDSTRSTIVMGNFANTSGRIKLDIGGVAAGQFDRVVVDGTLTAGGVLDVDLVGSYSPVAGQAFKVLSFADAAGAFALDLPALPTAFAWNASKLLATGELLVVSSADFDANGAVDGGDFMVWQRNAGLAGQQDNSRGDANGDGVVNAADLGLWRQQAAAVVPAGAAVPEPASGALVALAACGLAARRGRGATIAA